MTYKQIWESLSDKRKNQMAVMKLPGGTLFQVKGVEHDKESDYYCLLIGIMPEHTEPIVTDNQTSLDDLFKTGGL